MRMLFTTLPYAGHFHPLVPIAQAAVLAGHQVAFACAPSFIPTVEQVGFQALPTGLDDRGRAMSDLFPGLRQVPPFDNTYWLHAYVLAGVLAPAMAPDVLAHARAWSADLLVRDSAEYGAAAAAEVLGLPHASIRTTATSAAYALRHVVAEPLARLRVLNGLPPDPAVAMPFRFLHLACEPPGFARPGDQPASTAHLLRPGLFDEPVKQSVPSWLAALPDRPTVYVTLGTIASQGLLGRGVFAVMLEALRDEPITLILTVGRDNDPAALGPQPPNVHVERYIPQGWLLPRCDLVVAHGGFSTLMGALNQGLPLVLVPIGGDQPLNAACCAALGVGQVVAPEERTPEAIRAVVRQVLADPTYRRAAERVRESMAALPGPEEAIRLLEHLARERCPLISAAPHSTPPAASD
jgi:UDP:flavonoid glycosyltransferase YjiC (YdhE family)